MQESFRRSIRKMTDSSVRLSVRPNRSTMMATLSQSMMVTWSIVLHEHLDAMLNDPAVNVGTTELISYSETAWKLADSSFPQIMADANKLYDEEWCNKWTNLPFLINEETKLLYHAEKRAGHSRSRTISKTLTLFTRRRFTCW